jgi:hypothetical protein
MPSCWPAVRSLCCQISSPSATVAAATAGLPVGVALAPRGKCSAAQMPARLCYILATANNPLPRMQADDSMWLRPNSYNMAGQCWHAGATHLKRGRRCEEGRPAAVPRD